MKVSLLPALNYVLIYIYIFLYLFFIYTDYTQQLHFLYQPQPDGKDICDASFPRCITLQFFQPVTLENSHVLVVGGEDARTVTSNHIKNCQLLSIMCLKQRKCMQKT